MYTLKYLFYSSIYIKIIFLSLSMIMVIMFAMGMSKFKKIMVIKSYIKGFEEQFWSGIDLTQFYEANHENNLKHPLGVIFKAVWEEWQASEPLRGNAFSKADIKERMLNVAHKQKIATMKICETYMDTLSVFIHATPFLGLLGTTLGIIDVFYNLDLENGLTLTNAGLGIGGSLICLVFAMLIVVLSMILFWFFNMKIQEISDMIDGYIVDLLHILGRGLDTTAVNGIPQQQETAGSQMMQQHVIKEATQKTRTVSSGDDDDI